MTGYNVYHNVTSPDSHVPTINTYYNIDILRGYNYYFIVSPNNIIGEGDNITLYGTMYIYCD